MANYIFTISHRIQQLLHFLLHHPRGVDISHAICGKEPLL